jgi:hypothetical protein
LTLGLKKMWAVIGNCFASTWTAKDWSIICRTCPLTMRVELATVLGYPAPVRVWNRTGWSSAGCYPENRGTHQVRERVGTTLRFYITVPATLAPIKYLGSGDIMTRSICRLCSFSPSFTSRCQICDWFNVHWIAVKEGDVSAEKCGLSIATQWILVQSQMWEREGKVELKLHNLRTDHVTIQS